LMKMNILFLVILIGTLKPMEIKNFTLFISYQEINLKKVSFENSLKERNNTLRNIDYIIEDIYPELRSLAYSNFKNYFFEKNIEALKESILENNQEKILKEIKILQKNLLGLVGKYEVSIAFSNIQKQLNIVFNILLSIANTKYINNELNYEINLLKLIFIETSYIYVKDEKDKEVFSYVEKLLYEVIQNENIPFYLMKLKFICFLYSAIGIYTDLKQNFSVLGNLENVDGIILFMKKTLEKNIEQDFLNREYMILKKDLEEGEIYSNIDMLYSIALSFPILKDGRRLKIYDTIFRDLYTSYGMREKAKNGNEKIKVFPSELYYFVSFYLKENGVNKTTLKVAYNFVKIIFKEIDEKINGGVPTYYIEENNIFFENENKEYDNYTNAQIIRLYNLFR